MKKLNIVIYILPHQPHPHPGLDCHQLLTKLAQPFILCILSYAYKFNKNIVICKVIKNYGKRHLQFSIHPTGAISGGHTTGIKNKENPSAYCK